jgi:hypothetical protein
MSNQKTTFTDPQTGEEIESTWLARWVAGGVDTLEVGLEVGLIIGLFLGWQLGPLGGLVAGLVSGLGGGLVAGLVAGLGYDLEEAQSHPFAPTVHDRIARRQHFRRQRLLRLRQLEAEWAGVPNRALSQALPSGPPRPTDVSVSSAEPPPGAKPRLAGVIQAEKYTAWVTE